MPDKNIPFSPEHSRELSPYIIHPLNLLVLGRTFLAFRDADQVINPRQVPRKLGELDQTFVFTYREIVSHACLVVQLLYVLLPESI